jgi:magnesium transporter
MAVTDFTIDHKVFTWLDITDPTNEELVKISEQYKLHHYTLRDCLEPDHLPKHEDLGHAHFLITRLLTSETDPKADSIQEISIAIFYNEKFLITIHRRPQSFLKDIKDNFLDTQKCKSAGEIVTRIVWEVLNTYDQFGVQLSRQIDIFESKLFLESLSSIMIEDLYYIKRKASVSRKLLLLSGEVISNIRTPDPVTLQDLKDMHVRLLNMFGQAHEDVTSLLNTYLSMAAKKTNDVMKVLTVFSVFFMPLTFIAGIYGMNFRFMPELESPAGYPLTLVFMAVTSGLIFLWFRKKKWL